MPLCGCMIIYLTRLLVLNIEGFCYCKQKGSNGQLLRTQTLELNGKGTVQKKVNVAGLLSLERLLARLTLGWLLGTWTSEWFPAPWLIGQAHWAESVSANTVAYDAEHLLSFWKSGVYFVPMGLDPNKNLAAESLVSFSLLHHHTCVVPTCCWRNWGYSVWLLYLEACIWLFSFLACPMGPFPFLFPLPGVSPSHEPNYMLSPASPPSESPNLVMV